MRNVFRSPRGGAITAAAACALLAGIVAISPASLVGAAGGPTAPVAQAAATGADGMVPGDWPGWTKDVIGSRSNPFETAITPSTVGRLRPIWQFVFPDVDESTGSQPAVVGDTLYVGSRDAKLYALNARTGATRWSFDAATVAGPVDADHIDPIRNGPAVVGGKVVFGDNRANLYALDKTTGHLLWTTRLSDHQAAVVTGSTLIFGGRAYVGVASSEEVTAANASYPCCTFRGQLVAVDLATGHVDWRHYNVPEPQQTGTSDNGTAEFGPSGAAVWSTPVVDPVSRTVFFATGNNYTGAVGDGDSVVAVDADTGALKWHQKMTQSDDWTVGCMFPTGAPHCPGLADGTALDFDFGASPNLFVANGRLLVGVGQKSGVYHTFDAATGRIVWQQQLSVPQPNGGRSGIQWGSSYDGHRLYVATWQANPGTLFALDPATGSIVWRTPAPADGCTTGGAAAFPQNCNVADISAVSTSPGLVYEGSADGKMRVFSAADGHQLWQYDTVRQYTGVNGLTGSGGSIAGNSGAVVSHGMLYVSSGYYSFYGIPGRALLAFGI
jgi:polyvinyl alcohol dehydrogenase (cytochrome)